MRMILPRIRTTMTEQEGILIKYEEQTGKMCADLVVNCRFAQTCVLMFPVFRERKSVAMGTKSDKVVFESQND